MSVERIIGIDFGTSTSLVKVKAYRDGQPVDGDPTSTQAVEFDNGRVTTPTLIRFAGDTEYYGQDAVSPKLDSTLCKNFKLDLQSPDAAAKAQAQELTRKFFRFLYEQYSGQSTRFGQFDAERTLVSYPAKWKPETREFMIQAARDAGFQHVSGMDEPTAALYTVMVQESARLVQQGYLTAGKPAYVLMIDMGAGTTDLALCRYTPGGQNRIIDTWPPAESKVLFGGREMDELLIRYLVDYLKRCGTPEKMVANVEKNNLEDCKAWKENSVSSALARGATAAECAFITNMLLWTGGIAAPFPAINRAVLEDYCRDYIGRYAELIAGAMAHARQVAPEFDAGDLTLAVLTGGHSQWYFAKDMLCCALPGYEGGVGVRLSANQVVSLKAPQHTVSSGLVFSPQFPAPEPEPEPIRPKESTISCVLCLWVTESHTMAAYIKDGRLCLIKTSAGEKLPPLVSSESQKQVREDTLAWIKETAERESGHKMRETIIAVPCWFTMERFAALKSAAKHCGLDARRIVWELDMAACEYCDGKNSLRILLYYLDHGMESVAAFEWGDGMLETLFNIGRKVGASGQENALVSRALKTFGIGFNFDYLLFIGDADQGARESVLKQVQQFTGSRPEIVLTEKDQVLAGTFVEAEVLHGQREEFLLVSATPEWIGVRSDAWDETEWLIQAGTSLPTKKWMPFRIVGTQAHCGIYMGEEKLTELPFEIELLPDEETDSEAGQIEIAVDIDVNFLISIQVDFLDGEDFNFTLAPENIEKIRQAAEQKRLHKGRDVRRSVEVSMEEIVKGCQRTVTFEHTKTCSACGGAGAAGNHPCEVCGGTGIVKAQETVEVEIPIGAVNGMVLKRPELGDAGLKGEPVGDLLVKVKVSPHPVFYRVDNSDNIWCRLSVTPEQAAHGEVIVPTLDGKVSVKLPKGIISGQVLKLAGKGRPNVKDKKRGDQYVKIVLE